MKEVAIGDVCELINGRAFKPSDWSAEGLPIVRIQNLNNEAAPFNRYDGAVRDRFLIDSGALLFSWSGTPGTSFGAFFWHRGPAILNQHIFHVLPERGVDKNYLRYALNGRIERIIAQAHGGVGLQHITKEKLEATTIPLPPLPEQRRIADILDKADAIRRKRKEAIALTEELLRSAFLEMLGDPVTNPKGWPVRRLGEVAELASGVTKGKRYDGQTMVTLPYMRVANVQDGHLVLDDIKSILVSEEDGRRYRLRMGDLLLTEGGDPDKLGRGAVWHGEVANCIHQNHIFRVRPGAEVTSAYLSAIIGSERGKRYFQRAAKQTTGIASINMTQLKAFPVLLPPIAVQDEYARFVHHAAATRRALQRRGDVADGLFNSLVARAFSGALGGSR